MNQELALTPLYTQRHRDLEGSGNCSRHDWCGRDVDTSKVGLAPRFKLLCSTATSVRVLRLPSKMTHCDCGPGEMLDGGLAALGLAHAAQDGDGHHPRAVASIRPRTQRRQGFARLLLSAGLTVAPRTRMRVPLPLLRGQQEAQGWGLLAIRTVHSNRLNSQERAETRDSEGAVLEGSREAFWKKRI